MSRELSHARIVPQSWALAGLPSMITANPAIRVSRRRVRIFCYLVLLAHRGLMQELEARMLQLRKSLIEQGAVEVIISVGPKSERFANYFEGSLSAPC
jgi:hypothetical protein